MTMSDAAHRETMNRLAHGFEALLEQVQELDERNAHLEHLLDRMQEQVCQLRPALQKTPGIGRNSIALDLELLLQQ